MSIAIETRLVKFLLGIVGKAGFYSSPFHQRLGTDRQWEGPRGVDAPWAAITIPDPSQAPPAVRQYGLSSAWVVRAWEPNPHADAEPVEWVLLTSMPVDSIAPAQEKVE